MSQYRPQQRSPWTLPLIVGGHVAVLGALVGAGAGAGSAMVCSRNSEGLGGSGRIVTSSIAVGGSTAAATAAARPAGPPPATSTSGWA